jgi:replication factor A2
MQKSIIKFITSQPHSDEGVHVAAIARAIGGDAHLIR